MLPFGSSPIRPITGQHSLPTHSSARTAHKSPRGSSARRFPFERQYGFTTFPACHKTGLGSAFSPVVWWRTYPQVPRG